MMAQSQINGHRIKKVKKLNMVIIITFLLANCSGIVSLFRHFRVIKEIYSNSYYKLKSYLQIIIIDLRMPHFRVFSLLWKKKQIPKSLLWFPNKEIICAFLQYPCVVKTVGITHWAETTLLYFLMTTWQISHDNFC